MSASWSQPMGAGNYRDAVPDKSSSSTIFSEPEVFFSLPKNCYSVWIFFPTGDCVNLPIFTVKELFDIYPNSDMARILYGD